MSTRNPKVDAVLRKERQWGAEFEALRTIALDFGLTEELKWGQACYALGGKNVVLIHGFKEYCALLFFKGALLQDSGAILSTPGTHQASRQLRFTNLHDITESEPVVRAYVAEAIEVEKSGKKVELKQTADYDVPEEFQAALDGNPTLQAAFGALTPGRQRGYLFHIAQPKLAKTRAARVEKCVPLIFAGKGLND